MVFLKIEMGNTYYWFIPYCDNLYFLKFLNVNMLEMQQYLLCPTWNKAKNKEIYGSSYTLKLHNIYDCHKKKFKY